MLRKFLIISFNIMIEICLATESPRVQFMTFINSQLKDGDVHKIRDKIKRHSEEMNADRQLSEDFLTKFGPCFDGRAVTVLSDSEILNAVAQDIGFVFLEDARKIDIKQSITSKLRSIKVAIAFFKSIPASSQTTTETIDTIKGGCLEIAEGVRDYLLDIQKTKQKLKAMDSHIDDLFDER